MFVACFDGFLEEVRCACRRDFERACLKSNKESGYPDNYKAFLWLGFVFCCVFFFFQSENAEA